MAAAEPCRNCAGAVRKRRACAAARVCGDHDTHTWTAPLKQLHASGDAHAAARTENEGACAERSKRAAASVRHGPLLPHGNRPNAKADEGVRQCRGEALAPLWGTHCPAGLRRASIWSGGGCFGVDGGRRQAAHGVDEDSGPDSRVNSPDPYLSPNPPDSRLSRHGERGARSSEKRLSKWRAAGRREPRPRPPLRNLLVLALIWSLLCGGGHWRSSCGVSALSFTPTCPSDFYSVASTMVNVTEANSRSLASGDIAANTLSSPQEWTNYYAESTVLACDVYFPNAPQDMMLWHFGGQQGPPQDTRGAWLGLRDADGSDGGPWMRLRAGGGMALPDQMVSVVDINYSSFQDSQAHQVVAWISGAGLQVKLWIDGELQGASQRQGDSNDEWTDPTDGGSFETWSNTVPGDSIPDGEPNNTWSSGGASAASVLIMYQPATPAACTGSSYGSLLSGDWVSSSELGYVCCERCPENARVNISRGGAGVESCLCNAGYSGPDGGLCLACAPGSEKPTLGSGGCSTCEAGKYITYSDTLSGATCQECPAGKYNNSAGAMVCSECLVGSYKEAAGYGICVRCRNTTSTSSSGATSCDVCVRNALPRFLDQPISSYQTVLADSVCVPCPNNSMPSLCASNGACAVNNMSNCTCNIGYYGSIDSQGGGSCVACPLGATTATQGASNLTQCVCKRGFESNFTGVACSMCRPGTKKNSIGSVACTSCGTDDKDYITTSEDGVSCICTAGAYRSGGKCKPCLAGYAKAVEGDAGCTKCDKGKYTPSTNTGARYCLSCSRGKYNPKRGVFGSECYACKECPANTDSLNATGRRTGCVSNAGYTGRDGNIGVACAVGQYKPVNGSAACSSCAADVATSVLASTQCSCNLGYYAAAPDITGSNCAECPIGSAANETGLRACRICPPGTYTSNNGTGSTACVACTPDSHSYASSRQPSDCTCNRGFTGNPPNSTCQSCAQGFYKNTTGSAPCVVCAAGKYQNLDAQSACLSCPTSGTSEPGSTNFSMCQCNAGYTQLRETYGINCTKFDNNSQPYAATCPQNRTICSACPVGKSRAGLGNGECEMCQAESHSWAPDCSENDLANCQEATAREYCTCNLGFVQSGGVTSACDACTLITDSDSLPHRLHPDHNDPDDDAEWTCRAEHKVLGVCDTGITKADSSGECAAGRWWRACTVAGDSGCLACPANSYNVKGSQGQATCKCNKGYAGPDGGPCFNCPPNSYKNRTGDFACSPCPGITVAPNASVSIVNCTCPLGFEAALGDNVSSSAQSNPETYTADCQCAPGYYKPVPNASCTACAVGKFNNWSAAIYCDFCEIGYFADEPATTACALCAPVSLCPNGQFWNTCPGHVDGHCVPCSREALPGNASFSGPGRPPYMDTCPYTCNAGYDAIGSQGGDGDALENPQACHACPSGKYRGKFSGRCQDCVHPATSWTSGSAYCLDCAPGFCFSGFLADGHAECVQCPSQRTTTMQRPEARGYTDVCRCEPGYDGYSWSCAKCEPGTYKPQVTESSDFDLYLASVQGGSVSSGDTCQICPGGSFNPHWGSTGLQRCQPCSSNSFTHVDTSICACNTGYYDTAPDDAQLNPACSACPLDTFNEVFGKENLNDCLACPQDSFAPAASNRRENCQCNAGFQGAWDQTRIAQFPVGGSNWDDFCDPCPANSYATLTDDYCVQCPHGTFTNSGDRTSLDVCLCPENTFGVLRVSNWTRRYQPFNDWVPNNGTEHHCLSCPANSVAPSGSFEISSCVCVAGLSGLPAQGGDCKACPGETFPHLTPDYCSCNAGYFDNFSNGDVARFIVPDDEDTTCTICPPNSYSEAGSIGVAACKCSNGFFGRPAPGNTVEPCFRCRDNSDSSAADPISEAFCTCNVGFSGDPGGNVDCVRCTDLDPNSHTHISTDAQMCTCNLGYVGDLYNGSGACAPCPLHTYNNQSSQRFNSSCIACQNFSTTDSRGSDEFADCKCHAGYRHSGEECVPCEEERYQPARGQQSCLQCVANSYSPAGSDEAADCKCKPGFYRVGVECRACGAGFFKPFFGDAACDPCPANSTSSLDSTSCRCMAGYYGGPDPQFGAACTACPADTRQPEIGELDSSACIACPNLATSAPASVECVCADNSYGNPNANPPVACVACTNNSAAAQNSLDVAACVCREGFYLDYPSTTGGLNASASGNYTTSTPPPTNKVCLVVDCPDGAVPRPAAASASDCICKEGYYGNGAICTLCPANATAPVGATSLAQCVCKADFYGNPQQTLDCIKCPDNAVSLPGSQQLQDCSCKQGYFGSPGQSVAATTAPSALVQTTPFASNASNASQPAGASDANQPAWAAPDADMDPVNLCPATQYGHLLNISGEASHRRWPGPDSGFLLDGLTNDDGEWHAATAIIACRVAFPATPQDGLLWFFGDENRSTSLGLRGGNAASVATPAPTTSSSSTSTSAPTTSSSSSTSTPAPTTWNSTTTTPAPSTWSSTSTPTLRLRAGESGSDTTDSLTLVDVAFTELPSDGLFHEVVAIVGCNMSALGSGLAGPRLLLYIDGVLQGRAQGPADATAACSAGKGWASAHTSALGSYGRSAPWRLAGEPAADWPGSLGSDLHIWYGDAVWPECAGDSGYGTHLLWGNWSSPGMRTSVCCTFCPDEHQISVGDNRSVSSSCVCKAGYTGPGSTLGPCQPCPMATFKAAVGSGACSACAYGEYTTSAGSAECVAPTCKACPADAVSAQASAGLGDCYCKAGHYGNASTGAACLACPASASSPAAAVAQHACVCNQGFYGHPDQGVACVACPANSAPLASVSRARHIQNCTCNAGYYGMPMPYSNPACQRCPVDTYSSQPGALSRTDCTPCPHNSTTDGLTGAVSRGSCLCDAGLFGNLAGGGGGQCEQCPAHTFSAFKGALSQSFCRFCPQNAAAPGMGATSITECSCNSGYSGAVPADSLPGQDGVCTAPTGS